MHMKTTLITGIGRGIGRALAVRFLAEGYAVIGTTQTGTADLSDPNLKVFQLDLTSPGSIAHCIAEIVDQKSRAGESGPFGGQIDILINNAGVLLDDGETRLIPDKLRETLDINLIGTAAFTEAAIPALVAESHIVCISSQAGSITDMDNIGDSHEPYHYPAYKISKAALNMYVRTLAARLAHEGTGTIVSAVHPGWVKTDMGGDEAPTTPEEAAAAIFKLAVSRPETGQFWYKGQKYPW